jgi:hypothetical protein
MRSWLTKKRYYIYHRHYPERDEKFGIVALYSEKYQYNSTKSKNDPIFY